MKLFDKIQPDTPLTVHTVHPQLVDTDLRPLNGVDKQQQLGLQGNRIFVDFIVTLFVVRDLFAFSAGAAAWAGATPAAGAATSAQMGQWSAAAGGGQQQWGTAAGAGGQQRYQ